MTTDLTTAKDNWVYQSNRLIEASYSLTTTEQKLLRILASMIKKEDKELKEYEFKTKDLQKILGVKNNKRFYSDIDKVSTLLMSRVIKIKYSDSDNYEKYHFVEYAKYNNGTLTMKISPELKPFYMSLDQYTKYQLMNVLQFKSTYSFRLYELLKQYQKIGNRRLTVEDIRLMLDIKKDEYPKYANLKQKVIEPAVKEINAKTDLHVSYEDKKEGRKITYLVFSISSLDNKTIEPIKEENALNEDKNSEKNIDDVKAIIKEPLTDLEASIILNAAKGDIDLIRNKYEVAKVSKNIESIVAWMKDAIKNDYQLPKGKKQVGTFNNFEQRKYDMSELEKKLLGWDKSEDEVAAE